MSDSIEEDKAHSSSQEVFNDEENSSGQDQTGTRKDKRKTGRSEKSNATKRPRVDPASTVAEETDEGEDDPDESEEDLESEDISFGIIVRRLNCRVPGCKKVFPSKVHLIDHLLVKHAIEKFACKVKGCTESYATKDQMTIHLNGAHNNLDSDWPCGQCEVTCPSYQNLYTHIWYHEYGQFACSSDKCDFTDTTRIKVCTHQRKHRSVKCTYPGCSLSFNQKSTLTHHLRVHSKEKPFLCAQCPKAFAVKCNLTRHERVHSGLKPYSCTWPHCDFSASQKSTVIVHIRGVHFGLPQSKTEQTKRGIIDTRDPRVFVKRSTTAGN